MTTEEWDAVLNQLRLFVKERDWDQFHNPKNLAMAIASEAGELLAELRWVNCEDSRRLMRDVGRRTKIELEVGDIAIALILFCENAGINLLHAVEQKLLVNESNYPAQESKGRAERPTKNPGL